MRIVLFIDIVPIGPAGSGKTCLLAAMARGAGEVDAEPAPVISVDPVSAARVGGIWRSMRGDEPGWPAGTDRGSLVDLRLSAGEGERPLYEARLTDCAGSPPARELADRVRRAAALLCVLDGQRVAALLDGDRDGFEHAMTGVRKTAAARGRTVRFVVTKWDLLQGRATLAEVRDALLGVEGFAALVRRVAARPGATGSIGLLPVSVVGEDAARQAVTVLWSVLAPVLRAAAEQAERLTERKDSLVTDVGVKWVSQAVTAVAVRQVLQRVAGAVPEARAARRYAGHAAVGVSMLVEAVVRSWSDRSTRHLDAEESRARARLLTRAADAYDWHLDAVRREFPASDPTGAVSHRLRTTHRTAQDDIDNHRGYQNRIVDPERFHHWFYNDRVNGDPVRPEPVPEHWRTVV